MTGTVSDFIARLKMVLPAGWFADSAPNLQALLAGPAAAWAAVYALLMQVQAQVRLATATGIFLDIASQDYFGGALPRRAGEADAAFSPRLRANLLAPRATRAAVSAAVESLTGRTPVIFEPLNAQDTGGYNVNAGYNRAGGYGSFDLPYQFFITAYRPVNLPGGNGGGYGVGPGGYGKAPMAYEAAAELAGNLADAEIYATIAAFLPTNAIAWTNITN